MQCPYCESDATRVLESRPDSAGTVQRRRQCRGCGQRFATVERINTEYLTVRKLDGRIERFRREKIINGIGKAASVFRIPAADVNAFIDRILDQLRPESPGLPIPSSEIGKLVLRHLRDATSVTDVARIRFAMVFYGKTSRQGGFRDARDLKVWLEDNYAELKETEVSVLPQTVLKRYAEEAEPFDIHKLERSIGIASKGRGSDERVRALAQDIAARAVAGLRGQSLVTSQQIASEVLKLLRERDGIAYLRYASAVKPFRNVNDFWMETLSLVGELERDQGGDAGHDVAVSR
jgi:transcriptional repressor NrdR